MVTVKNDLEYALLKLNKESADTLAKAKQELYFHPKRNRNSKGMNKKTDKSAGRKQYKRR